MGNVTTPAPGMPVDRGSERRGVVFDYADERLSIAKPGGLHIELVDALIKERVENGFNFAAWFHDEHILKLEHGRFFSFVGHFEIAQSRTTSFCAMPWRTAWLVIG
jgi:hypothetical protein